MFFCFYSFFVIKALNNKEPPLRTNVFVCPFLLTGIPVNVWIAIVQDNCLRHSRFSVQKGGVK